MKHSSRHFTFSRSIFFWCLVPAAGFLAGCSSTVDLQAVQKYAQATADASTSFASVAADFNNSCLRRRELTLRTAELHDTLIELAPAYTASPLPTPGPTPPALGQFDDARCVGAKAISDEWDKRNQVVLGYVQALGAIASVDVRPTFAPLTDSLVKASLITQTQDDAFTKLAQTLSNVVIGGAQRQAIARTVTDVDPSLRVAIGALKNVDDAYGQLLNAEFNQTFDFYSSLITSEVGGRDSIPPTSRNVIYGQRQIYNSSLTDINDRRTSTIGYASVLDGIEKTHEKLFEAAKSTPKLQDYVTIVEQDVIPLFQDVEALRKATK